MNTKAVSDRQEAKYFAALALAPLAYGVAGFGPGFFSSLGHGYLEIPLYVHAHAVLMMGWLSIFLTQALLIACGKQHWHRVLGRIGIVWLTTALATMAMLSLNNLAKPVPPPVDVFLGKLFSLQVSALVLGPVFLFLALRSLPDKSDHHRRYMSLLTLFLVEAATVRMGWLPGVNGLDTSVLAALLYPSFMLLLLIALDVKMLGRLHSATVTGLVLIFLSKLFCFWAWQSPFWQAATSSLETFLRPNWPLS